MYYNIYVRGVSCTRGPLHSSTLLATCRCSSRCAKRPTLITRYKYHIVYIHIIYSLRTMYKWVHITALLAYCGCRSVFIKDSSVRCLAFSYPQGNGFFDQTLIIIITRERLMRFSRPGYIIISKVNIYLNDNSIIIRY